MHQRYSGCLFNRGNYRTKGHHKFSAQDPHFTIVLPMLVIVLYLEPAIHPKGRQKGRPVIDIPLRYGITAVAIVDKAKPGLLRLLSRYDKEPPPFIPIQLTKIYRTKRSTSPNHLSLANITFRTTKFTYNTMIHLYTHLDNGVRNIRKFGMPNPPALGELLANAAVLW